MGFKRGDPCVVPRDSREMKVFMYLHKWLSNDL